MRLFDFLARRRTGYIRTFNTPFGERVLEDLARFCRAHESTFHPDARVAAVLEGRREVWLRIQQHLQLTDEQLWAIYNPQSGSGPRPTNTQSIGDEDGRDN